ncbi:hypothetical protein N7490_010988 [Penicillium lividum]|nr:hypothetical protein N7490_010988 [Penicillium lividum]
MVAELLVLMAPALGPITEFAILGIKKCWKSYREHTKAAGIAEPRIANRLQEMESKIEEICNILSSRLGESFTKGDKQAYIDLRRINNEIHFPQIQVQISQTLSQPGRNIENLQKIEMDIEKTEKVLVEALLELSKRKCPDQRFWLWRILMPLMTLPSLRNYSAPFAAQVLKADPPAQISYPGDFQEKTSLDSLQQHGVPLASNPGQLFDGRHDYCKGSIALQKQPSQGIESISLKVKGNSAYGLYNYRCTLCYLDLEDNVLEPWSSAQWICLGMSHVMATISTSRMVACFKCVECNYRSKSVVYTSAKLMMSHIQDHILVKPVSGVKAYYKELLQSEIVEVESFEIQMKRLQDQIDRVEKKLDEAAKEIASRIPNSTPSADDFMSMHSESRSVSPVSSDCEQKPVSRPKTRQAEAKTSGGTTPTGFDYIQTDSYHSQPPPPIQRDVSELATGYQNSYWPNQQISHQERPPASAPIFDNRANSQGSHNMGRSFQQSPPPVELYADTKQGHVTSKQLPPAPRGPPPELPGSLARSAYPSGFVPGQPMAQAGRPTSLSRKQIGSGGGPPPYSHRA